MACITPNYYNHFCICFSCAYTFSSAYQTLSSTQSRCCNFLQQSKYIQVHINNRWFCQQKHSRNRTHSRSLNEFLPVSSWFSTGRIVYLPRSKTCMWDKLENVEIVCVRHEVNTKKIWDWIKMRHKKGHCENYKKFLHSASFSRRSFPQCFHSSKHYSTIVEVDKSLWNKI